MSRSTLNSRCFSALLFVLLVGCSGKTRVQDDDLTGGGGSGEGAAGGGSPDGGNTGEDTGGSSAAGGNRGSGGSNYLTQDYCFDPDEVEACASGGWYEEPFMFFDATTLDAEARFLSVDGASALLEIPEENDTHAYRVVTAQETFEDEHVRVDEVAWPDAVGSFEVRHAWSGYVEPDNNGLELGRINALGCDDERCLVFTNQDHEADLAPVPDSELPLGTQSLSFEGLPCAFGESALCWDGTAFTPVLEVPPGAGERFTHFFFELEYESFPRRGLAVTDAGAILMNDSAGQFQQVVPPHSAWGLVVDVEFTGWEFTVLFDSGAFWLGQLDASTPTSPTDIACFDPGQMQFLTFGQSSSMLAVDATGSLYERSWFYLDEPEPEYRFCALQATPVPHLLHMSQTSCGLSTNLLGITEHQFFGLTGPISCPIG